MMKKALALLLSISMALCIPVGVHASDAVQDSNVIDDKTDVFEEENIEKNENNYETGNVQPQTDTLEDKEKVEGDATEIVPPSTENAITTQIVAEDFTGWNVENGQTYYYVNGVKLQNIIYEIEGNMYGFYGDGTLVRNTTWWYYGEDQTGGEYRADQDGKLIKGWYYNSAVSKYEYYGMDDYIRKYSIIVTLDDKQYYFDQEGFLFVHGKVQYEGVLYNADENGVLTVVETSGLQGWLKAGGFWYYYENGEAVKQQLREIGGVEYYFGYDGTMATGPIWIWDEQSEKEKIWLAEPNGAIVRHNKGWYYSSQKGVWYYFKEKDVIAVNEFVTTGISTYYFDSDGCMKTGVFSYYDEETGEYNNVLTDNNGIIQNQPGWKKINGNWYYIDSHGKLAVNEKKTIGNKTYLFDYSGVMKSGEIYWWNPETEENEHYITDVSGAVIKNGWTKIGLTWYYLDVDGQIMKNQWILNNQYYLMAEGQMAVGTQVIDGVTYVFNDSGKLISKVGNFTGWKLLDGIWYYYDTQGKPYNGWLNNTYYINNGKMLTNQWIDSIYELSENALRNAKESVTYYVGADGKRIRGWYKMWGSWLYGKANGELATGWQQIGSNWYWFDEIGFMASGTMRLGNEIHSFTSGGAWLGKVNGTNRWVLSSSGWYYLDENGNVYTGTKKNIGSGVYYFDEYGIMRSDQLVYDDSLKDYVYVNASGREEEMKPGWKLIGSNWYHFEADGKKTTGLKQIGNATYYFSDIGQMLSGYFYVNDINDYRFFGSTGAMRAVSTGWYTSKLYGRTQWYYFENGKPASGYKDIGGITYYFYYDGRMATGLVYGTYGIYYVFGSSGNLIRNSWALVDGIWYYGNGNGRAYTGERTIGGKTYWFNSQGEWVK
ncbi:hypothetical protein NE575_16355 [Clostridium sp. SL.3.18]|nr:hypothetical protein [Clostridium sp. SL.3.18]